MLRLIGDGHGNLTPVRQAARAGLVVVHLGDLGFERDWRKVARLQNLHVVAGNHDDVPFARSTPVFAGDYGSLGKRIVGADGIFFVRGAATIDVEGRRAGKDWWPGDEELTEDAMTAALAAYAALRPNTVLSHEAPTSVVRLIHGEEARPSRTSDLLEAMLAAHSPARWFFGHHHVRWQADHLGTRFRCLGIDETLDVAISPGDRPERERWLYESPGAMDAVVRGLEQSVRGETRSLGAFAPYVEDGAAEGVEYGTGNVFEDLGLPDPEARLEKAQRLFAVRSYLDSADFCAEEAAELLGVTERELLLLRGGRFSAIGTQVLERAFSRVPESFRP